MYGRILTDLDAKLNAEIGALQLTRHPKLERSNNMNRPKADQPGHPCPMCKEGVVRRPHGQDFFGCSRYKDGFAYKTSTKTRARTLTDNQVRSLITTGRVGPLKDFKSKDGKIFEASVMCTAQTQWKTALDFK